MTNIIAEYRSSQITFLYTIKWEIFAPSAADMHLTIAEFRNIALPKDLFHYEEQGILL